MSAVTPLRKTTESALLRLTTRDLGAVTQLIGLILQQRRKSASFEMESGETLTVEWTEAP